VGVCVRACGCVCVHVCVCVIPYKYTIQDHIIIIDDFRSRLFICVYMYIQPGVVRGHGQVEVSKCFCCVVIYEAQSYTVLFIVIFIIWSVSMVMEASRTPVALH